MTTLRSKNTQTITLIACNATLGACVSYANKPVALSMVTSPAMPAFNPSGLPAAVQVPARHRITLETTAAGTIVYSCNAKANAPGQYEWVFVGPSAPLKLRSGQTIGTYYGPPATWAHNDGSVLTGVQLAVAPNNANSIPLQLVKANPKAQAGVFAETTYIQRVNTAGGIAPKLSCGMGNMGEKQTVEYSADYIFWKSN
jgi:hypothetical protein